MTYQEYVAKWQNHATRKFENFKAEIFENNNIQIVDWHNKNNSNEYNLHFLFEPKRNSLYISGDLGNAMFIFTETANIFTIGKYTSIDYFTEKMTCSTDRYYYDEDTARQQIREELMRITNDENITDTLTDEIMETYNQNYTGVDVSDDTLNTLINIDGDCHEWLYSAGQFPAPRIIIWLTALNMARRQLISDKADIQHKNITSHRYDCV